MYSKTMDELNRECQEATSFSRFKVLVNLIIKRFYGNPDLEEHFFLPGISHEWREHIHTACKAHDTIRSKSVGEGSNRRVRLKRETVTYEKLYDLPFNRNINDIMDDIIDDNLDMIKVYNPEMWRNENLNHDQNDKIFGRLSAWMPPKVPEPLSKKFYQTRISLPVWSKKKDFLSLLNNHQIILICAETGSGKTTQIPQYILENACENDLHCKIICTQPRRISTVSVAQRVAQERGEMLGDTVGFQIKLESRIGLKSALIYCTNGILLRTLMNNPDKNLRNFTHLIIDEIHERDKHTDFILITLKQYKECYPNLKIILMSATADVELFCSYFPEAALLSIPGKLYSIEEFFLDDILLKFNSNESFKKLFSGLRNFDSSWLTYKNIRKFNNPAFCENLERIINDCVEIGDRQSFDNLMESILSESGDINFQTSTKGFTSLMAAAMHGKVDIVLQLLKMDAELSLKSHEKYCYTALEWAKYYKKAKVISVIEEHDNNKKIKLMEQMVNSYEENIKDEAVDVDLIVSIVLFIRMEDCENTILIFLPGYEDIVNCQERIASNELINASEIQFHTLHSSMPMTMQNNIFSKSEGSQKIIIATNIAETSITIPDVVYVIDTGLSKEKGYDTITGTGCLKTTWISKANVTQRAGRAGRTRAGTCYHTFSKSRYSSLFTNQVPEILRVPLHDLCMQTKLLAPVNCCIADYLQLAINPPSKSAVKHAIQSLKTLGALDDNENLTNLGKHLVQLSVDPRLGKMLIYGVIFKCLDPILTIVSALAHSEPFILPLAASKRAVAAEKQRELSENSASDHVVLLKAYQYWLHYGGSSKQNTFAKEYFINVSTMSSIQLTRSLLLSQLRATGFVQVAKSLSIQELNRNSHQWYLIRAVIACAYYPNLGFFEGNGNRVYTKKERAVTFTRTSCLSKYFASDGTITYNDILRSEYRCIIRCATLITPLMVALLCGEKAEPYADNSSAIDCWLFFKHSYVNLDRFRSLVQHTINCQISNSSYVLNDSQCRIMNALSHILFLDDSTNNMPDVSGIGYPPKQQFGRCNGRNSFKNVSQRDNGLSFNNLNISKTSTCNNGDIFNNIGNFELPPQFGIQDSNLTKSGNNNDSCDQISNHNSFTNITKPFKRDQSVNFNVTQTDILPASSLSNGLHLQSENFYNVVELPSSSKLLLDAIEKARITTFKTCNYPNPNKLFFIIQVENYEDMNRTICTSQCLFSLPSSNRILEMFNLSHRIYLFFSIINFNKFYGFAELKAINNINSNFFGELHWLSTNSVSFRMIQMRNLENTLCDNFPVYFGYNGQEINYSTGKQLADMFFEETPLASQSTRPILGTWTGTYIFLLTKVRFVNLFLLFQVLQNSNNYKYINGNTKYTSVIDLKNASITDVNCKVCFKF